MAERISRVSVGVGCFVCPLRSRHGKTTSSVAVNGNQVGSGAPDHAVRACSNLLGSIPMM
jgi:hypothetical protein